VVAAAGDGFPAPVTDGADEGKCGARVAAYFGVAAVMLGERLLSRAEPVFLCLWPIAFITRKVRGLPWPRGPLVTA
jgi:hypothetical protein